MKKAGKKITGTFFGLVFIIFSLVGCGSGRKTDVTHVIGVSLANQKDEWRIELRDELEAEAADYPGYRLIFLDAGDDVEKQKNDLNELIGYGAELLIVSPVDIEELITSVEDIYKSDMPILLLDRTIKGFDYTCFFGTDDRLLVQKEVEAFPILTGKDVDEGMTIVNILIDNYTGRQRASLLRNLLPDNVEIRQLIIAGGTRDETEDILKERPDMLDGVDLILTQNDYMAKGASLALDSMGKSNIKILGVDGFQGEGGGIEMVQQGIIDATIVCPTGGSEALGYASNYFNGMHDGPKQIIVRNTLVTEDTVDDYLAGYERNSGRSVSSVGYVQIKEDTGFRRANTNSYIDAASDYGVSMEIRECSTQEEQIAAFRDFLDNGKDVIILSPIIEEGWDDVFAEAKEKDVPVILSDREVNLSDTLYTLFVGADFAEEGARCMRWVEDNVNGSREVSILELAGTPGSSPAIGRGRGFRDTMKSNDRYKIIGTLNGNFSRDEGYQVMKDYLTDHGDDFDVLFCHNDDMMLGAIEAIREAGYTPGDDIKILSIDGTTDALHALSNGEANYVAECTPLLGPDALRAISMMSEGDDLPLKIISSETGFEQDIDLLDLSDRKY